MEVQVWYEVNKIIGETIFALDESEIIVCDGMNFSDDALTFYHKPPQGGPKMVKRVIKGYKRFNVLSY